MAENGFAAHAQQATSCNAGLVGQVLPATHAQLATSCDACLVSYFLWGAGGSSSPVRFPHEGTRPAFFPSHLSMSGTRSRGTAALCFTHSFTTLLVRPICHTHHADIL
jgi:hypothetical protein